MGDRKKEREQQRENGKRERERGTYLHQSPRIGALGLDENLLDDGLFDGLGG